MILNGTSGYLYRNTLLSFFYSLAFFLSVQVRTPIWQFSTGESHSSIGAPSIHLLPIQEHNSKQTSVPLYPLPVIIFQGNGNSGRCLLNSPAIQSLIYTDNPDRSSSLGSVSILLPILRI
ncbi:MAG: hypothetical protein IPN08_03930 [Bacteroidales bacterium]|nr:hypothetical protein [Bacteroidales bacterium]MBK9356531.1 hypothetical protein [Bacteroidales bacterium]